MTTMSWLWLLPPITALAYFVAAELFLIMWWESPSIHSLAIYQRFVVVIACMATIDAPQQHNYLLVVKISIVILSLYLIYDTRVQTVQGGSAPASVANDSNRVIVITGANTGIGKETARLLACEEQNTTLILACRSLVKAQEAADEIRSQLPACSIECVEMDLSSLASVRKAALYMKDKYPVIDVLINNAGLMHHQYELTTDGYERVLQVNHLGHYLWTRLLLPCVLQAETPKIINITSSTYVLATWNKAKDASTVFPFHDLHCNKGRNYSLFGQYGVSKLANIYFTISLAQRYPAVQCCAVHPGLVRTDVVRNMPWYLRYPNQLFGLVLQTLQKTPAQGAWGAVHAVNVTLQTGLYWVNRKRQAVRGFSAAQLSLEVERLWRESAVLVDLPLEDDALLLSSRQ